MNRCVAATIIAALGLIPGCREPTGVVKQEPPVCGHGLIYWTFPENSAVVVDEEHSASGSEILVGRHLKLVGAGTRYSQFWSVDPAVRVYWCSSNPDVVEVRNDSLFAQSVGEAKLFVFDSTARGDSMTVRVVETGYDVEYLGDVLGDGAVLRDMNDSGEVLFFRENASFLLIEGQARELVGCTGASSVNNHRQVVCSRNSAIWEADSLRSFQLPGFEEVSPHVINDAGDIAGVAGPATMSRDLFLVHADQAIETWPLPYGASVSDLSNNGIFTGLLSGVPYSHGLIGVSGQGIGGVGNRGGITNAVNESGDIVGQDRGYYGCAVCYYPALWRIGENSTIPYTVGYGPFAFYPGARQGTANHINESGHAVGDAAAAGKAVGWLWRGAFTIVLSDLVTDSNWVITRAIRISDAGEILGTATNATTGQSGPVMLRPQPQAP
jgi:hypothetical protein